MDLDYPTDAEILAQLLPPVDEAWDTAMAAWDAGAGARALAASASQSALGLVGDAESDDEPGRGREPTTPEIVF